MSRHVELKTEVYIQFYKLKSIFCANCSTETSLVHLERCSLTYTCLYRKNGQTSRSKSSHRHDDSTPRSAQSWGERSMMVSLSSMTGATPLEDTLTSRDSLFEVHTVGWVLPSFRDFPRGCFFLLMLVLFWGLFTPEQLCKSCHMI